MFGKITLLLVFFVSSAFTISASDKQMETFVNESWNLVNVKTDDKGIMWISFREGEIKDNWKGAAFNSICLEYNDLPDSYKHVKKIIFTNTQKSRGYVLPEASSCKGFNLDNANSKLEKWVKQTSKSKTKSPLENVKQFYYELQKIKTTSSFKTHGLSDLGPHYEWFLRLKKFANSNEAKSLTKDRIVAVDLVTMAMEYVKSNGKETEVTKFFKSEFEAAF